jgi:hypothetical protein
MFALSGDQERGATTGELVSRLSCKHFSLSGLADTANASPAVRSSATPTKEVSLDA